MLLLGLLLLYFDVLLFWAYFIFHGEFLLLLLLVKHGFKTHGEPDFKKDSRMYCKLQVGPSKYITTFLIDV